MIDIQFFLEHKDIITVIIAISAFLLSLLNFFMPYIHACIDRKRAIFLALQEDRKTIAVVTRRVLDREWDSRIRNKKNFRQQLLRSLSIATALEKSDRGKAYALLALKHIVTLDESFRKEAIRELQNVETVFQDYEHRNADPSLKKNALNHLELSKSR